MTVSSDSPLERGTMGDDLAERLRRAILVGEIAPGERLRIKEIQDKYGVSHIPVREALRVLEGEGLVVNSPRKGATAAPLSVDQMREVYDARRLLEPLIIGRAVLCMTPAHRNHLRGAYARMTQAENLGMPEFFDAHREFHWGLLRAGATPTLERIIRQLWSASERYVRVSKLAFARDVNAAVRQHEDLLRFTIAGESAAASTALLDHLHLTERTVLTHADVARAEDTVSLYEGLSDARR